MITSFRGEYAFLSNMYEYPVHAGNVELRCAETLYQMLKTRDREIRKQFIPLSGPAAKQLGRRIQLRSDWNYIRIDVMRYVIRQKFNDPVMREKLLATGDEEIQEHNYWGDTFWGVYNGRGENWLGKILMEEREKLRR